MSLVGEERKKKILDILEEREKVTVQELSKKLNVSTETIRRYLEQLENENKVKKVYGGAIRVVEGEEPPFLTRKISYPEEKKRIGKRAAEFVTHNDVIALDEGSTPLQMIPFLTGKMNLTVITPSFAIAYYLMENQNNQKFNGRIYFLGGEIDSRHQRSIGSMAAEAMERFYFNKAFISADGFTVSNGATCYGPEKGILSRKMMAHAEKSFLLVDHSKIGVRSSYRIAPLNEFHKIICDGAVPPDWKEAIAPGIWEVAPKT